MTTVLNKEIDRRLREVIADQTNLWSALSLVRAFHHEKVLASDKLYAIDKEVPVFTDEKDWEAFLETEATAKDQNWVQRSILDVLEEAIRAEQSALIFNKKTEGDRANFIRFKTADMIEFVNHHTQLLNLILSEQNQKAEIQDKFYLVPGHEVEENGQIVRQFSQLVNPDKERFIPVFSNMASFANWYNNENFGTPFRQRRGKMIVWKISDLLEPQNGTNQLGESKGIVINPFIEAMEIVTWEQLKN